MNLFSKSLLAGAVALVLAPLSALALPESCDVVCDVSTPCTIRCAAGSRVVTCGQYGLCAGMGFTHTEEETLATVDPREATPREAEPVCREPARTEPAPAQES